MVANFALVIADVVFYAVAVDWLGFFITASVFLSVLFLAFGVRRARIVPLAAIVTLGLHYSFYTLLRVPLPWGLLGGIAW
jgi:putative tricarboxylic transport membrane protein